jgi:hypothetical protein
MADLNGGTMPRYTIPRVAHCSRDCEGGALAMPRWLIFLIAILVVLVIAILVVEHTRIGIH